MAFRASNIVPEKGLERAKTQANYLRRKAGEKVSQFSSGANADDILALASNLRSVRNDLASLTSISGLAEYAREQENDSSYDIVAEFNALLALVDDVITEIVTTFPVDSSGYLLSHTIDTTGQRTSRTFSAAAISGVVSNLNALVAGIA